MRLYFDTAYVAKCYLNEPDGAHVRKLARKAAGLCSSALCLAEMACVLHRQVREGALAAEQAAEIGELFLEDVRNEMWHLFPLWERTLLRVEAAVRGLPAPVHIRAGDAIHLVTASDSGFQEIWTNDRHLLMAAPHLGLRGRSV